jgi:hypothetical protein
MHIHRVDLKGKEHVPESVYHLVYDIDPVKDASWGAKTNLPTDEIHVTEVRQGQVCTHVYLVCVFLCMYECIYVCVYDM